MCLLSCGFSELFVARLGNGGIEVIGCLIYIDGFSIFLRWCWNVLLFFLTVCFSFLVKVSNYCFFLFLIFLIRWLLSSLRKGLVVHFQLILSGLIFMGCLGVCGWIWQCHKCFLLLLVRWICGQLNHCWLMFGFIHHHFPQVLLSTTQCSVNGSLSWL